MILGLDLGTSTLKILCIDFKGNTRSFSSAYIGDGTSGFYCTVKHLMQRISKEIDLKNVTAIGLTSQSCSYILFSEDEYHPFYSWHFKEGQKYVQEAKSLFGEEEFKNHISMPCPEMHSYPIPRVLWLRNEQSREWSQMQIFLQPKDYLYYRFTGNFASDKYTWRGLANLDDGTFHDEILLRIGLKSEKLPKLYSPFESAGGLNSSAASDLGLAEGIPVFLGCNDFYASLLGMGIIDIDQNFDITGTSEHIGSTLDHFLIQKELISCPYIKGYVLYGVTNSSGRSIKWYLDHFGGYQDIIPEDALDVKPPIFLPYLDGERAPIWNASAEGAFFGINSCHGKGIFFYSVLEGVAFSLCHIWDTMCEHGNGGIRVSGGAAINNQLNRIKAALLDRPIIIMKEKETSALGAAICAAVGSGLFSSLEDAVNNWVKIDNVIYPEFTLAQKLYPRYEKYRQLSIQMTQIW